MTCYTTIALPTKERYIKNKDSFTENWRMSQSPFLPPPFSLLGSPGGHCRRQTQRGSHSSFAAAAAAAAGEKGESTHLQERESSISLSISPPFLSLKEATFFFPSVSSSVPVGCIKNGSWGAKGGMEREGICPLEKHHKRHNPFNLWKKTGSRSNHKSRQKVGLYPLLPCLSIPTCGMQRKRENIEAKL